MLHRELCLVAWVACSGSKRAPDPHDAPAVAPPIADAAVYEPPDMSWRYSYDFDGDGKRDVIDVDYSGGAHCCYHLTVVLSSGREVALPFELDGGYTGGLSLERPENFTVEVGTDGAPRLVMTIATYGGRLEPIPREYARLGVRSHFIAVSLREGIVHVENRGWSCGAAIGTLVRGELTRWEGWPSSDCAIDLREIDGRSVLEKDIELGSAKVPTEVTRLAYLDHTALVPHALLIAKRDGHIVRVDIEDELGAIGTLVDAFGPPDARLPYERWGFVHRTGQWLWASRGLVAYVDRRSRTIVRIGVFPPTDRATFERDLTE